METTYEETVKYMYEIFNDFFSLPTRDIDKREGDNGRGIIRNQHIFYVLQDMGLSIARDSYGQGLMHGAEYRLYDSTRMEK